jgi:hypothetical protein
MQEFLVEGGPAPSAIVAAFAFVRGLWSSVSDQTTCGP